MSLNRDSFVQTLHDLMFDGELPYPYEYSQSTFSLDANTSNKEVMQLAIGQGQTTMSPLHMNLITQAVANGGILMNPILVDSVKTGTGTVITQNSASQYKQLFDSTIADDLKKFMRAVVTEGTASKLSTAQYEAAGKTGSAEFDTSDSSQSHAWFTGFAPYDDPKVCVTVIIEGAGSGGDYAVPIARRVFDKFFNVTSDPSDYETGDSLSYLKNQSTTGSTEASSQDASTAESAGDSSTGGTSAAAVPNLENVIVDPETGDLLDTTTGTLYDPTTGAVVGQKNAASERRNLFGRRKRRYLRGSYGYGRDDACSIAGHGGNDTCGRNGTGSRHTDRNRDRYAGYTDGSAACTDTDGCKYAGSGRDAAVRIQWNSTGNFM
jgi:membrane peptidoglycan carboxypeptidase